MKVLFLAAVAVLAVALCSPSNLFASNNGACSTCGQQASVGYYVRAPHVAVSVVTPTRVVTAVPATITKTITVETVHTDVMVEQTARREGFLRKLLNRLRNRRGAGGCGSQVALVPVQSYQMAPVQNCRPEQKPEAIQSKK